MHGMSLRSQQANSITPVAIEMFAAQARLDVLDMLTQAKSSHLGCSFSIIDILVVLYHHVLDVALIKAQSSMRDYFILSKGHGAAGFYAVLAGSGFFDRSLLLTNHHNGSPFAGHPIKGALSGIEASTGSLGHGVSMAVGIALACKHDQKNNKVYALVGDGECQEGAVWEAVALAARLQLASLTVIVDYNNLQGLDRSDDLMPGSLQEKFEAFGWHALTVDGHCIPSLIALFTKRSLIGKPCVIIARTIKGKGLPLIQDCLAWHYKSFSPDDYIKARKELE